MQLLLSINNKPKIASIKFKKTNDPDPGSYNHLKSYKKVSKRPITATISHSKIKSFNEQASHDKRHVPAPGTYDYMPAYNHISRPMKKGRR